MKYNLNYDDDDNKNNNNIFMGCPSPLVHVTDRHTGELRRTVLVQLCLAFSSFETCL